MTKQPDIVGDVWFNTKPLTSGDLRGKVVLVDFWTYSCVNCLRTIPYLRQWWKRYKDKSFVLLGVHSPEFDFEKDPANVERAIKDLGIGWPVVLDNELQNWRNFSNQYWPAKYLVDKEGNIVYTHFGEGGYEATERKIAALLAGEMGETVDEGAIEADHGGACFVATPELYCGYGRGAVGNRNGFARDRVADYKRPDELDDDGIALSGRFLASQEYIEAMEPGATLLLKFRATEVNLVLKPAQDTARIAVRLDGKIPDSSLLGDDVDDDGIVTIVEPRMYNLLHSDTLIAGSDLLEESVLSLEGIEGRWQAFAFTFSGCKDIARDKVAATP